MRVLLVRPPVPEHTMGLKHVMICEPLELEYVAAGLVDHEVRILDLMLERDLEGQLRRFAPDVVGTSCYITGVNEVIKVCRTVRRFAPACRTVVGGVHAACAPEDFADASIDCIVLGDGTRAMLELLDAFARGKPLESIPGLALPRGTTVFRTAAREYMGDPQQLPLPRRDLVAHLRHRYYYLTHRPVALLKATWGCWYRCTFCVTWRVTGGCVYARSPESIVDELATLDETDVYIVDDIFLIQPERLRHIAQLLRARGIHKQYLVYARADFIAEHEEVVADWADLGLAAVFLGLEAASDAELDAMDKRTTVDVNRQAIAVLQRHRVDVYGSLITQPDYGPEDWARVWRFIEETGLYFLNISPLTPLPGTLIWEQYRDRVTVPRAAHGLWDLSHVLLPTRVPLGEYYRSLLNLYVTSCLDFRRARQLTLNTRPSLFSAAYLRLWWGAFRIWLQMRRAHRHHDPDQLALAMGRGPGTHPVSGASDIPRQPE